jgi:hypothetical protein
VAQAADYPHGLYLRGELAYSDLLKVVAQKIGSRFRPTFTYSIFDIFDRGLQDGTANLGMELSTGADWFARAKADWTTPGDALTTDWRLGRKIDRHSALKLAYQTYQSAAFSFSQALGLEVELNI